MQIRNRLSFMRTTNTGPQNGSRSEKGVERMTRPIIKLPCTAQEFKGRQMLGDADKKGSDNE